MTEKSETIHILKQRYPQLAERFGEHTDNSDFQELCEDLVFLINQIAQSQKPAKRQKLTKLKMDLERELKRLLS